ncbi:hypothetical protein [Prosthecobacter fusiformis]|nr:hypothetical protein [Prosthecobacter fusiformis]
MTQFCEQLYVNPGAAHQGSQALLATFDDSGLWLASLAQPAHLVAELRHQCALLTRVVVTQWTRQGETHKLVRLAEALMDAQPPVLSHEAGQIMALLASLLGILRPGPAPRWLAASRPLLRDSVDPHLIKEAVQWVSVGQLLAPLPQEDRHLWNRRLRDPEHDWDWESQEALDALRHLAVLLPEDHDSLHLFRATIPRCWWELWRDQRQPRAPAVDSKAPRFSNFILGLAVGVGCMMLAGGWTTFQNSSPDTAESVAPQSPVEKGYSFHAVDTSVPQSPYMKARQDEIASILKSMPELERMYGLVKKGNLNDSLNYVQGQTSLAAQGSREYQSLLRCLMLDPPLDLAVRSQVAKAAVRVLTAKEMFTTLQLCLHPDSPNLKEARECAELLLALSSDDLTEDERQILFAASTSK